MEKSGAIPFELQGAVHPETSPYLVTKSKGGVLWVEESSSGNIRAGVCSVNPADIFMQIVEAVAERGLQLEWGNVHPYSLAGIKAAADYLNSYGVTDMEVLIPRIRLPEKIIPKTDEKLHQAVEVALGKQEEVVYDRPEWLNPKDVGLPLRPSSWLPNECAVVVPAERDFVGELTHISSKYVAAIVHNPSRTIAIAWNKPCG